MSRYVRGDPALKTQAYRQARAALKARRDPCARCGRPIDYDGPRFYVVNGKRIENPWAFDCGHIIARAFGGTEHPSNLQAEHVKCGRVAGAKLGAQRRWGNPQARTRTSRIW